MSNQLAPRVTKLSENFTSVEYGVEHTDGFRVTVGWSEEDQRWVARCSGMRSFIPGEVIGTGFSSTQAICDLCCALAATVDCMGQAVDKGEEPRG